MSTRKALVLACLIVLPGVVLRVAPYADRLLLPVHRDDATHAAAQRPQALEDGLQAVPARLSDRPLAVVALGFSVEVGIYVVLIGSVLRSCRLMSLFDQVPRPHRVIGALFFTTLIAGFLAGGPASFPFVAWRMYSGVPVGSPTWCVAEGVTRSGAVVRVDPQALLPALRRHRAYNFLALRGCAVGEGTVGEGTVGEGNDGDALPDLPPALQTLARLHNRRQPADPVERISVYRRTILLDTASPPWVSESVLTASVAVR